jgi:CubicO group peptidase (beta-lactamase class C family)
VEPAALPGGGRAPYGYGIEITELEGKRQWSHGGSTPGYDAWFGYYPDQDLSVAILTNSNAGNAEALGKQVARRFLGVSAPSRAVRALSERERALYAGEYRAGGGRLRVYAEAGILRVAGPVEAALVHHGEHTFSIEDEPDVNIVFHVQSGRVTGLSWTARGRTLQAARLP